MRENLMSGSMWQGMETRTSKSQAPSLDPTNELAFGREASDSR
jgi:hypothetical protein